MMPGLSGFEVCQSIRNRYNLLELPILMVTASIQAEDKTRRVRVGGERLFAQAIRCSGAASPSQESSVHEGIGQ